MTASPADVPPRSLRFRRRLRLSAMMRELWGSRVLLRALAERELRARYKQAVLGVAWVIFTPVALVVAFTVVFDRVANIDTGGAPYALFAFLGLLPWTFFSTSLSTGAQSLVINSALLNKMYCPREVFPLSSILVSAFDFLVSTSVLAAVFAVTGYAPRATSVWVPLYLVVQLAFTVGIVLVLSPLLIYVRDFRLVLPIILQIGLFATPVAYPLSAIASNFRVVYVAINPLAFCIDGYRRSMLFSEGPDVQLLLSAGLSSAVVLFGGYALFKRLETGLADVA